MIMKRNLTNDKMALYLELEYIYTLERYKRLFDLINDSSLLFHIEQSSHRIEFGHIGQMS